MHICGRQAGQYLFWLALLMFGCANTGRMTRIPADPAQQQSQEAVLAARHRQLPTDPAVARDLAALRLALKRPQEALEAVRAIAESNPDDALANQLMAEAAIQSQHPDLAVPALRRLLARGRDLKRFKPYRDDLRKSVDTAVGQNQSAKAMDCLTALILIDPDESPARKTLLRQVTLLLAREQAESRRLDEALVNFGKALELTDDAEQKREIRFELGTTVANAGDFAKAHEYFSQFVGQQPKSAVQERERWLRVAAFYEEVYLFEQADQAYDLAVRVGPADADLQFRWGQLCLKRRDLPCATERFDAAVAAAPDRQLALQLQIGQKLEQFQQNPAALARYQAAAALQPTAADPVAAMVRLADRTGQRDDIVTWVRDYVRRGKATAAVVLAAGTILEDVRLTEAAMALYQEHRALAEQEPALLFRHGALAGQLRQPAERERLFGRYLQLAKDRLAAAEKVAHVYFDVREYGRAESLLRGVLNAQPENERVAFALADLYRVTARPRDEIAVLDAVCSRLGWASPTSYLAGERLIRLGRGPEAQPFLLRHATAPGSPRAAEAYRLLGEQALRESPGNAAKAREYLLAYVQRAADRAAALEEVRRLYQNRSEQRAYLAEILEQMAAARPNDSSILLELAEINLSLGRQSQALDGLRRFIATAEDRRSAVQQVVRLLTRLQRQPEQALVLLCELGDQDLGDPELHRRVGETLAKRGEIERARFHFRRYLEMSGPPQEILRAFGDTLVSLHLYDIALEVYQRVLPVTRQKPEVEFAMGRCYLKLRRLDQADQAFRAYIEHAGNEPFIPHRRVADQYRRAGLLREALKHAEFVLQPESKRYLRMVFPEMAEWYARLGEPERIEQLAARMVANAPDRRQALQAAAAVLAKYGQHAAAVTYYKSLQTEGPNDFQVVRSLTEELLAVGETEATLDVLRRHVTLRGKTADVRMAVAQLLAERGMDEEAVGFLDEMAANGQSSAECHLLRGRLHLQHQRFELAHADFVEAVTRSSNLGETVKAIRQTYMHAGRFESLAQIYRMAIAAAPAKAEYYFGLAETLFTLGRTEEAEPVLVEFLNRSERGALEAAQLLRKRGEYRRAAGMFEKALDLSSAKDNQNAMRQLFQVFQFLGQSQEMDAAVRRFLSTSHERAQALSLVGTLYEQANRPEMAAISLEQANRLEPDPERMLQEAQLRYHLGQRDQALALLLQAIRDAQGGERQSFFGPQAASGVSILAKAYDLLLDEDDGPRLQTLIERAQPFIKDDALYLPAYGLTEQLRRGDLAAARDVLRTLAGRANDDERDPRVLSRSVNAFVVRGLGQEATAILSEAQKTQFVRQTARILVTLLSRVGRLTEAQNLEQRILRNSQEPAADQVRIGQAYLEAGQLAAAESLIRRALIMPEMEKSEDLAAALGALGRIYLQQGKPAELIKFTEQLLEQREDHTVVRQAVWQSLAELQLAEPAAKSLDSLLLTDPRDQRLRLARLRLAILAEDESGAWRQAEEYARNAPSRLQGWRELLEALNAAGHIELARRAVSKVLELDGSDLDSIKIAATLALQAGVAKEADTYLERFVNVQGGASSTQLQAAEICANALHYGCARRWLQTMSEAGRTMDQQTRWKRTLLMADMAFREGKREEAQQALEEGVDQAPDLQLAQIEAGSRWLSQPPAPTAADAEQALKWAEAALKTGRPLPGALLVKSGALISLKRTEEATMALEAFSRSGYLRHAGLQELIRLGLHAQELLFVKRCLAMAAEGQSIVQALESTVTRIREYGDLRGSALSPSERNTIRLLSWEPLQRLLDRDPLDLRYLTWKADLLEKTGDTAGAEETYRTGMRILPRVSAFPNNLAYLFARRAERLPEAQKLVRRSLQLEPAQAAYYLDTEGWVDFQSGYLHDAERKIRTAIRLAYLTDHEGMAEPLFHWAMTLERLGKTAQAAIAYRLAASGEPDSPFGILSLSALQRLLSDPFVEQPETRNAR